jgi:allophanate hydrolase subunit 2
MAYEKLQGYLALEVLRSDVTNIPYQSVITASTTDGATLANNLVDSTKDFIALGVAAGDIVYNTTDSTSANVLNVTNETTILLDTDIMATGEAYTLYDASSTKNYQNANNGCVLYVGTTGNLKVDTITGSTVTFKNMPVGFFPVQVKKVYLTGTTATDIIALW